MWTIAPFWIGTAVAIVMLLARHLGSVEVNPVWNYTFAGHPIHLFGLVLFVYGPLIDSPHLFATIARTYTDTDEWASRKRLFIGSLAAFLIGPLTILLPYLVGGPLGLSDSSMQYGWLVWSNLFTFYAIFHINKQHWGFVALYKRKNGDSANEMENRIDEWFFYTAIWLPFIAWQSAPWYVDYDGKPLSLMRIPMLGTTSGAVLNGACHVAFFATCLVYIAFQVSQYQKGIARNGPKLLYLATIMPLWYLSFAVHPLVAAFWFVTTGIGHCAQYHRVVWAYGQSKYVGKQGNERRLSSEIFERVWLYAGLGVMYGLLFLQGPGAGKAKRFAAMILETGFLAHAFSWLGAAAGVDLGFKMATAFVSGVRLHHFYVDSKIWRVSKSAALAKNLNV
jgi:hypothetical protein